MDTAYTLDFSPRLSNVCPSSWVSWGCYALGLGLATTPDVARDLASAGTGAMVLATSILLFFVSASLVQRHMRLSLLSSSYGRPRQLTTSGVFRITRNPIYVAFLLPLASLGIYSPSAAVVAISTYILAMTVLIVRREEATLRETFGSAYDDYAARTPRWLLF